MNAHTIWPCSTYVCLFITHNVCFCMCIFQSSHIQIFGLAAPAHRNAKYRRKFFGVEYINWNCRAQRRCNWTFILIICMHFILLVSLSLSCYLIRLFWILGKRKNQSYEAVQCLGLSVQVVCSVALLCITLNISLHSRIWESVESERRYQFQRYFSVMYMRSA